MRTVDVQEVHWSDREDFLEEIKRNAKPVIIKNSPAVKWEAIEKWKDEGYLSQRVVSFRNVITSPSTTIFYYDATRELMKSPKANWKYNFTVIPEIGADMFAPLSFDIKFL